MHPKHPKQNRHWGWHIFQTKANCILRGSRCRTYPSSLPRTIWAGSVFKQGLHCVEMAKHAFSAWSLNVSHLVSTCVHTYICTYIYSTYIIFKYIHDIWHIHTKSYKCIIHEFLLHITAHVLSCLTSTLLPSFTGVLRSKDECDAELIQHGVDTFHIGTGMDFFHLRKP